MSNRLVGLLTLACAVSMGVAVTTAQDVSKQNFKVVGTWSNLTNYQANEQPFWAKTMPEASKGQITANIQSISELGLKGTEVVRLVRLGLFDFAQALPIYVAEDAIVEGIDIAGVAKNFDMARKTVDAYAPVLNATVEKKYGARVLNYYTWPSQMFYCNAPIKGIADIKGRKVRVQGTSQGDLVEALGATGVTIPFAEVVPALQRGTVDCGITGTMPAYKAGWHEVTSHVLNLPVGFSVSFTLASLATWGKLDDKTKTFHRNHGESTDRPVVEDHHRRRCHGHDLRNRHRRMLGRQGRQARQGRGVQGRRRDTGIGHEGCGAQALGQALRRRCELHQQLERHHWQDRRLDRHAVEARPRPDGAAASPGRHFSAGRTRGAWARCKSLLKWFGAVARVGAIVGGWALMAISIATCVEVLGRKYFSFSFRGLDEIGGYMLAGVSAFGFAYALSKRSHMRVTLAVSVCARLCAIAAQRAGDAHPGGHGCLLCLAGSVRGSRRSHLRQAVQHAAVRRRSGSRRRSGLPA